MREDLGRRTLLGMLTPSSNTVLEPVTSAMLAGLDDVSAHFGRFRVTEISMDQHALGQFTDEPMLQAAELLADAKVDVVCWNGTSASWLGFDKDVDLCARIEARTGIAACSSVLALKEVFERTGVHRFGLVTPYIDDIQARIVANFAAAGVACPAERHLGDKDNFSFSEVSATTIAGMCRAVAAPGVDAIAIVCTNVRGGPLTETLEAELGVPVYDSVATSIWASLRLAGVDPRRVRGWGRLFDLA
jgi:maleate isomerase